MRMREHVGAALICGLHDLGTMGAFESTTARRRDRAALQPIDVGSATTEGISLLQQL